MKNAVRTTGIAAIALLLGGAALSAPADASFAGRNGRLAFTQITTRTPGPDVSDVWSARADGTHRTRLTTSGTASEPAWSKSAQRIAYVDAGAIAVMNLYGHNQTKVVTAGWNSSPSWSPDGRRLAFVSERGQAAQLFVYDLASHATTQLTQPGKAGARVADAEWSPRGDAIVFARDTGGQSDLYTVKPDGSGLRQLTNTADISELGPDWSPDGRKLVYYRFTDYRNNCFAGGIYWLNTGDLSQHLVVNKACSDLSPLWSPDGRRVLWQRLLGPAGSTSRDAGLWTTRPNGKDQRRLVTGANRWFDPAWARH